MTNSTWLILAGIIGIIGGGVALLFPLPASLAVTVLVGWLMIFAAALTLYAAISQRDMPSRGWAVIFGLIELAAGVWIIANPLGGMVSLTIVLGALFFASGLTRIWMTITRERANSWSFWLMLASGLISTGLGLYILFLLPEASLFALGIVTAIELLMLGSMALALGVELKRDGK